MKNRIKSSFFIITSVMLCLSAIATDAIAQDDGSVAAANILGVYSSSTTIYGGTTTSGVLTTVGVVWLVVPLLAERTVQDYLRNNTRAVHHALAVGGGPTVGELAHIFGVKAEHKASFAQLLRQERQTLSMTLSSAQPNAKKFISHIKGKMRAHAQLRLSIPAASR